MRWNRLGCGAATSEQHASRHWKQGFNPFEIPGFIPGDPYAVEAATAESGELAARQGGSWQDKSDAARRVQVETGGAHGEQGRQVVLGRQFAASVDAFSLGQFLEALLQVA